MELALKKLPNLDTQEDIARSLAIIAEYIGTGATGPTPTILGVDGEPSATSELTRYDGYGSYPLEIYERVNGNYIEYNFDRTRWPYNMIREVWTLTTGKFIKFPKAYYQELYTESGAIKSRRFSDTLLPGYKIFDAFLCHRTGKQLPYVLIGAYSGSNEGGRLVSKAGVTPQRSTTLEVSRNRARANNIDGEDGYQLFDFHIRHYMNSLYLITMADTNSDKLFPQGAEGTIQATGVLDQMESDTGYYKGLDNYLMKFLGIENFFSNLYTQVDGVKIYNRQVYVSNNPDSYNSLENLDGYVKLGETPHSDGYIKEHGAYDIPIATGAGVNSYYADYLYQSTDYQTLFFGRGWGVGASRGLFYWFGAYVLSVTDSHFGVRLVKKPIA